MRYSTILFLSFCLLARSVAAYADDELDCGRKSLADAVNKENEKDKDRTIVFTGTFGTRADLQTLAFGSYTCDATVLVRGTSGIVCPH